MAVTTVNVDDTFEQWRVKNNLIGTFVGDHTASSSGDNLNTTATTVVAAINEVNTAQAAIVPITLAKMAANSIDSDQYVDGSIDTAHLGALQVTTAKIAADAIDGTKLADNAVASEHLAASSITSQTAETSVQDADVILIYDNSASVLKKMTRKLKRSYYYVRRK